MPADRDVPRPSLFRTRRGGFTLIELLIVIVIAGAIMTYAIPRFQATRAERTARNARDVFAWTAQRARARAVQTGTTQLFQINPSTEKAWVVRRNGVTAADTLLRIDFTTEYDSEISTDDNGLITVCFGPRGYAYAWGASCNTNATANVDITFTHANNTSVARLKPLGQVERL